MENALWGLLPVEVQAEVDRLISNERCVHAIALVREHLGEPMPRLHECVDLVDQRFRVLRQRSSSP